jgi:hypothetical protein
MFGIGTLIGAAAGGLGSLFGGNKTTPDAQTQAIRDAIFQQANGLKGSQGYKDMLGQYQGYGQLGLQGAQALGGDQQAFGQFMNPYLKNVLDQSNSQFDLLGNQAQGQVADRFTQAGAFGGSRAAVAGGTAAANLAAQRAQMNSSLLYGGFNDAQQRAGQAAGLGLQGNEGYLSALGLPSSIYSRALPGGTQQQSGGGLGRFITGALGGGILGGGQGSPGIPAAPNMWGQNGSQDALNGWRI